MMVKLSEKEIAAKQLEDADNRIHQRNYERALEQAALMTTS